MNFNIPDLHQTTSNMKGKDITCITSSNYPTKIVFPLKLTCQIINHKLKHPMKKKPLSNATLVII